MSPFVSTTSPGAGSDSTNSSPVGITAAVLKERGALNTPAGRIILAAAVIDDILGLMILSIVSGIADSGSITAGAILVIVGKSVAFLAVAIGLGRFLTPHVSSFLPRWVYGGEQMKLCWPIVLMLLFSAAASAVGLAPIVGAFAAGLVLDQLQFHEFHEPAIAGELREIAGDGEISDNMQVRLHGVIDNQREIHVENLIAPLRYFLTPFFFVHAGALVNLSAFLDPRVVLYALILTAVAVAGKLVAGLPALGANRWLVGWGMVPRGEVGLIFASVGASMGVLATEVFSVIVVMVVLTTFAAPPVITRIVDNQQTAPAPGTAPSEATH